MILPNKRFLFGGFLVILFITLLVIYQIKQKSHQNNYEQLFWSQDIITYLEDGDLICRLGDRFWSNIFKDLSIKDKRFSHVGVVYIENEKVSVIHSEGDTGQGNDNVCEVTLDEFLKYARSIGIYRLKNVDNNQISKIAMEYLSIPFDWEFDMYDNSKLYCTELIYVILKLMNPPIYLQSLKIESIDKDVIPLEAISNSPNYFTEIYFSTK